MADWKDDFKGEVGQKHDKEEDNFSVCSDWDADLEDQDQKNLKMKEQKNNDSKTPQASPKPSPVDTFVHKLSKASIKQLDNQSNASSEAEDQEFYTLAILLGHRNRVILENIN